MALLVNGERIEDTAIQAEEQALRQQLRQASPEQARERGWDPAEIERHLHDWAKENLIERMLMNQEAAKDTTPIPEDVAAKAIDEVTKRYGGSDRLEKAGRNGSEIRAEVERRIRLDRLVGKVSEKVRPPKTKDVAEHYRKNRGRYNLPEMVHAAHIVKNVDENQDAETALAAIKQAEERIRGGASLEEVADTDSDCPGNRGDLGYFPRGEMVEEFDEIVFNLPQGVVSPVFRTTFGFHIAKVLDRRQAGVRPLAEVKGEIEAELLQKKRTKALEDYVDRLRAKAEITEVE